MNRHAYWLFFIDYIPYQPQFCYVYIFLTFTALQLIIILIYMIIESIKLT